MPSLSVWVSSSAEMILQGTVGQSRASNVFAMGFMDKNHVATQQPMNKARPISNFPLDTFLDSFCAIGFHILTIEVNISNRVIQK